MRKTAIMDLQIRIQTSPQRLRVPKRYQPLWLLTMSSSRQNQLMMSITTRHRWRRRTRNDMCLPPLVDAKGTKVGVRIPCQGVAAAMTFALFTLPIRAIVCLCIVLTCTLHWVSYVSTSCWRNRCTCISSQSIIYHAYRRYIATNTYLRRR